MQPQAMVLFAVLTLATFAALVIGATVVVSVVLAAQERRLGKRALEAPPAGSAALEPLPPSPRRLALPDLKLAPKRVARREVVLHRPASTRHPIVLAHGYLGFDAIGLSRFRREYFVGIRGRLEAHGHRVHLVRIAPAAGIALRAAELARQIRNIKPTA